MRSILNSGAVVFGHCCRRLLVAAVTIVTTAAILHAALPTEPEVAGRTSFAGQLLIASPELRDPFDHAVTMIASMIATARWVSSSTGRCRGGQSPPYSPRSAPTP